MLANLVFNKVGIGPLNNLIKQKMFYIYQYKLILQRILCIAFSAIEGM